MGNNNPIEIFATKIQVRLQQDTMWLSLDQMTKLFDRDKSVISRHLANAFKEGELKRNSVVGKICNN